jgi:aldehyde dehydrogenase (NAD+)
VSTTHAFIHGEDVETPDMYENIDPSTSRVIGGVASCGREEVNRAVESARQAHEHWKTTSPQHRAGLLTRLSDLILRDVELLARTETEDSGKPLEQARNDARVSARYFQFYAHAIDSYYGETIPLEQDLVVYTTREPFGVTAHVLAWNYPMQLFARGVAPAVAAGNCCVAKPADETPRTAVMLARLAIEAGFPPGVINVVTGLGHVTGAALTEHPDVDHVGFVGSTDIGKVVARAASDRAVPSVLELGGKSAQLIFPDADLDAASASLARAILQNAGQTCSAGARALVHASVHDEVLERVRRIFETVTIGPGIENLDLGPLVSRKQQVRVQSFLDSNETGEVLIGGSAPLDETLGDGAYFLPTLVAGVDPGSRIAQEEIFGPVLVANSFTDDDEAVALANGTQYALLGSVWTSNLSRAHRLAARIHAGQVYVNTYGAGGGVELPFGGFKKSGYGREKGVEALRGYTQTKTVIVRL